MTHRIWPVLGTVLLAGIAFPAWSSAGAPPAGAFTDCVPDPQRTAVAEPYQGYQATGYKGAMERDTAWFAAVRPMAQPHGAVRYVFKHTPPAQRVAFESIETLSLGGKTVGFAAYRQGCGALFDARGKALAVPTFDVIEDEYTRNAPPHSTLLKRKVFISKAVGTAFSYVRFTQGRLVASSPHQYLMDYSPVAITSVNTELEGLSKKAVAISDTGGMGLLDLRSLREVLAPRWLGVGQITDFARSGQTGNKPLPAYLLARDAQGLQLHRLDGQPIALPHFDRIGFVHGWYPQGRVPDAPYVDPIVVQTQELETHPDPAGRERTTEGPCRLYDATLQPLLDTALPASACLHTPPGRDSHYFAYSADGKTEIYRKQLTAQHLLKLERTATDIDGKLVYALDSGAMLLQTATPTPAQNQPPQARPYRLVSPEGQDIPERRFDDFHHLSCGFVTVRKDEQRWMLNQDGSLSSGMRYPFSC